MALQLPKRVPAIGFYYHYKHDPKGPINNYAYEVLGVGFHTEEKTLPDEKHFLIYRPLYEAAVYKASKELHIHCFDARPLEMWMENVVKDGKTFPRFRRIMDPAIIGELQRIRERMY